MPLSFENYLAKTTSSNPKYFFIAKNMIEKTIFAAKKKNFYYKYQVEMTVPKFSFFYKI